MLERLFKAGWILRSYESKPKLMMQWTDEGLEKLATLCPLLDELGWGEWQVPEKNLLLGILWFCDRIGPDEDGVISLGRDAPEG